MCSSARGAMAARRLRALSKPNLSPPLPTLARASTDLWRPLPKLRRSCNVLGGLGCLGVAQAPVWAVQPGGAHLRPAAAAWCGGPGIGGRWWLHRPFPLATQPALSPCSMSAAKPLRFGSKARSLAKP